MSLLAFQQTLAAMVASPDARRRAAAGDEREWPSDLDARELRRLRALARDPGLRTGTLIHRSFRLSMLASSLPRSCKALGAQAIKALTHAYWSDHPPRSLLYRREALRFAAYALPRLRAGELTSPWLPEVLEAEAAGLELLEQADMGLLARTPDAVESTPRLAPDCRLVPFRHEPLASMDALAAGRLPEGLVEGEHYLLVRLAAPGRVEFLALDARDGRALRALPSLPASEALERWRASGWLVG